MLTKPTNIFTKNNSMFMIWFICSMAYEHSRVIKCQISICSMAYEHSRVIKCQISVVEEQYWNI